MNIGDLLFRLLADGSTLTPSVNKEAEKAGDAGAKTLRARLTNGLKGLGGELKTGFAQGFGVAGALGIANVAATAVSSVVDGMGRAIQAASDLNETMTKSEVIFGDNAKAVSDWGETASDAFGQSKRQAIDTASGFAGLFKTVGIGIDQSTEYAKDLTKLGSDLASFFNSDVQEAIDALKSGLSGESEPLRRFNVFLSETAVNAKLAQMGIKKVGGQFTEAQKATARYSLIMEQTTDAQGDFARTSDGLANAQRTMAAKIEELSAKFGAMAVGPLADLTVAFSDFLDEVDDASKPGGPLDTAAKVIGDLSNSFDPDPMYEATTALGEFDKAGTDALTNFVDLITFWDGKTSAAANSTVENFKRIRDAVAGNTAPEFVSSSREMSRAMGRVADKTADARTGVSRLSDKVGDLAGDFKDLAKFANDAGDALAEAAYGPEELALAFGESKRELGENERELERVRKKINKLRDDGKPVPKELKDRFHDLRVEVNDGKQEVIRLGTRLRITGKISMADLRSQFAKLGIRLDGVKGDAKDVWYWMNLIANTDLGTIYDNQGRGGRGDAGNRATGGAVTAGSPYWVNENTARTEMFVPSTSGYVLTHADAMQALQGAGGSGGGDNITIPVYVTGVLRAETPEDVARPLRAIAASGAIRNPRRRRTVEVPSRG